MSDPAASDDPNQMRLRDQEFNSESEKFNLLNGSYVVIWTTTPWTLPGNRAISYSQKIEYALYEVTANERDFGPKVGERYLLAKKQS
ncbi:MAG: hypothetical protein ACKPFK_12935, partial [Dolichospermum sp.]